MKNTTIILGSHNLEAAMCCNADYDAWCEYVTNRSPYVVESTSWQARQHNRFMGTRNLEAKTWLRLKWDEFSASHFHK